ncbi:MAG TPA: hypothetical protein VKH41_12440 [Myxococcota bacterium]|nr:hypothetical protein [Myxococcota bacterium]
MSGGSRTIAFVCGLGIGTVGAAGILAPSILTWIAEQFVSSGSSAFYLLAAARIAFGLILISAATASRAPRVVRILGCAIALLGAITAVTGLAAIQPARGAIESWVRQGPGVARLTALPILCLGGFIAYSCAPTRRAD